MVQKLMDYVFSINLMGVVLLMMVLGVVATLFAYHKDKGDYKTFDLTDLIMENGRISKLASTMLGAFVIHSWIMVELTLANKMTEGYITLYGTIWIAPVLAQMFTKPAATPPTEKKNGTQG